MGDRLRAGKLSRYVTSHPGQLSLAIPLWVGAMSTSLGWKGTALRWPCVTDNSGLSTYGFNGLWKGDEHPAYGPSEYGPPLPLPFTYWHVSHWMRDLSCHAEVKQVKSERYTFYVLTSGWILSWIYHEVIRVSATCCGAFQSMFLDNENHKLLLIIPCKIWHRIFI